MTFKHKITSRLSLPLKRSLMSLTFMSLTFMSVSLVTLSGCGYHWGARQPSPHAFRALSPYQDFRTQGFRTWRVEPSPLMVEPPERLQHLLRLGYQEAGGSEEALFSLSASLTFTVRPLSAHISSYKVTLSLYEGAQPHAPLKASAPLKATIKEIITLSHPPQGPTPSQLNSKLTERLMRALGARLAAQLTSDVHEPT